MRILRKGLRPLLIACFLAVMFSIGAAILPGQQPVAKAGINGSQILFSCHSPMGRVIIKGENQHGNNVTWQGEGQPSLYSRLVVERMGSN